MPKIIHKGELNQSLLIQLLPKIHSGEIFNLNTNQIAKLLNISKATLYKVYPSKEEIYANFIDGMINFIENDEISEIPKNNKKHIATFDVLLNKLFSISLFISPSFLQKLKIDYSDLYKKTVHLQNELEKNMVAYYHKQIEAGNMNKINPEMLVIQQKATLQYMLNEQMIFKYEMNIREFVTNYYQLQKKIIFKEVDNNKEVSHKVVDHLTEKIKSVLL